MKTAWRWVTSKKVVAGWLALVTIYDVLFTFFLLNYFSKDLGNVDIGEFNPMLSHLMRLYGLQYTILVLLPLIMFLVILLIYSFWDKKFWRWIVRPYGYFLSIVRVGLVFYNFHIISLLFRG